MLDEKKIEKITYPQVAGNNECKDKKQIKEIVNYYNNLKLEKIEEEDMDYNPAELVGDSSQSEIHYTNGDIEEIIIYEEYVMIIKNDECTFYKKNSK